LGLDTVFLDSFPIRGFGSADSHLSVIRFGVKVSAEFPLILFSVLVFRVQLPVEALPRDIDGWGSALRVVVGSMSDLRYSLVLANV
jgi:hypothetical protein